MIRIFTKGRELKLYANTSITIEYNNNVRNLDNIEGDIAYNFDVPIDGNEIALGHWNQRQAIRTATQDCILQINGVLEIHGELNITKSGEKNYSVSVVITPFPEEWKQKKLWEIEGEKKVIAANIAEHQQKWNEFLKMVTLHDVGIKFGPVWNEEGYGSMNEDYGYWKGQKNHKMINNVFLIQPSNNLVVYDDLSHIYLHNETHYLNNTNQEEYTEINQTTLCPQVKMQKVIETVLKEAGYSAQKKIKAADNIYIQCTTALDGTRGQYIKDLNKVSKFVGDEDQESRWQISAGTSQDEYSIIPNIRIIERDRIWFEEQENGDDELQIMGRNGIVFRAEGFYNIKFRAWVPIYEYMSGNIRIVFYFEDGITREINENNIIYKKDYAIGTQAGIQINEEINIDIRANFIGKIFKVIVYYNNNFTITGGGILEYEEYELWKKPNVQGPSVNVYRTIYTFAEELEIKLLSYESTFALNIYKKEFDINKYLPDVSCQDFIKKVKKDFGLSFFSDYQTKKTELQTLEETIKAKSINLTKQNIENEETIEKAEKELYTFKYKQEKEEEIDKEKVIARVETIGILYNRYEPLQYYGKLAFVINENKWYRSEKVEDEEHVWTIEWVEYSATTSTVEEGSGKENEIESECKIPMVREFMNNYIPESNFEIISELYNDSKSDEIILLYHRGLETCTASMDERTPNMQCTDMTPFRIGKESITAESMGEKYIRPMLRLMSEKETINNKYDLTTKELMELIKLFKPQNEDAEQQTRLIQIGEMVMLPIQLTIEISNNSDRILAETKSIPLRNID